jgi:hypothetical protein
MWRKIPEKSRAKQEIEPGKENPKVLDSFEINCIWSSLGEPEL